LLETSIYHGDSKRIMVYCFIYTVPKVAMLNFANFDNSTGKRVVVKDGYSRYS